MDAIYVSLNKFTLSGDKTAIFMAGRRVRADCGIDGYKYGTISGSSYSPPDTTVTLTDASDDLTSNLVSVKYGIVGKGDDQSLPEHIHDGSEGSGGDLDDRYLYKENTDVFTPDGDYEPATKKYVDDGIATISGGGDMQRATYDIDDNNIVDKAESVDDGTYSATASGIQTHIDDSDKHREIDDSGSGTTDLWSANKISTEIASSSGTTNHSELNQLDYVSAGHTGFSPDTHLHDDRYYTETEVDTISGSLSDEIDSDVATLSGSIDHNTINNTHNLTTDIDHNQLTNYSVGEHRTINDSGTAATDLWSAEKIDSEITTISGKLDDHNELNNLDYASAGHTGFSPDTHDHNDTYYTETELNNGQLDNRYYTESEVDTISGSLSSEIDSDISTHEAGSSHDSRYYTETEVDTISGSLSSEIDSDITTNKADYIDGPLSPQVLTGMTIASGTNTGTGKVAAGTALLRTTDSESGVLEKITLTEQDNINLTASGTTYKVVLKYNSGSPQIVAQTAEPNFTTDITLGKIYKEPDDAIHFINGGRRLNDGVAKVHRKGTHLRPWEICSGIQIADEGSKKWSISAGHFFRGINEIDFSGFDTTASGGDTFTYVYDNNGTWVYVDGQTDINVDQYNNTSTGLATCNVYKCDWVFVHPTDEHVYVVYGQDNTSKVNIELSTIPNVPDLVDTFGVLIGRIIIDGGVAAFNEIQMIQTIAFTTTTVVDHNDLSNLDGGTSDEYYHLTNTQHTDLTDGNDATSHKHDNYYYTEAETDTISGSLSDEIDSDIITFSGTIDHDTLVNYSVGQHRIINDSGTSATELWSASKIYDTVSGTIVDGELTGGTPDRMYYVGADGMPATTSLMTFDADTSKIQLYPSATNHGLYMANGGEYTLGDRTTGTHIKVHDGDSKITIRPEPGVQLVIDGPTELFDLNLSSGNTLDIDGINEFFDLDLGGVDVFDVTISGVSLESGPKVNEILDSNDAIDAFSADDQLATAKLIYNEIATISGLLDEHNELKNIQGGTTDEYYHLTANEEAKIYATANALTLGTVSGSRLVIDSGATTSEWTVNTNYDAAIKFTKTIDGEVEILTNNKRSFFADSYDAYVGNTTTHWVSKFDSGYLQALVNSTAEMEITTGGMQLKTGATVNEILDSGDTVTSGSTDDQLATTKLIYNHVDTISGTLSDEIDSDISTHSSSGDHDGRYYTETEVGSEIATFSGTIDHNTINNTHNLTTDIDHNQLTNYSVGEHRTINDSGTAATDLWSAEKINTISGTLDTHLHDGDILQIDGINSDGGTFDLQTTGYVQLYDSLRVLASDSVPTSGSGVELVFWAATSTGYIYACDRDAPVHYLPFNIRGNPLKIFKGHDAGGETEYFALQPGEVVVNDPGNDVDFRVESDTDTHAFFVRGSDGYVGIGTTPSGKLTVGKDNTAYDLSILTDAHLVLNNTTASGQDMLIFAVEGAAVGGVRGDYQGNFNWHATGPQGHQFYTSLDVSAPEFSVGASGILVGGTAGQVSVNALDVKGEAAIGSTYATTAAPTDGMIIEGSLGVGKATAPAKLTVEHNNYNVAYFTNTKDSSGAGMIGYTDDGAATENTDRLGFFILGGAEDAAHTMHNAVGMLGFASEDWSDTANGAYLTFEVTADGSIVRSQILKIDSVGIDVIGNITVSGTVDGVDIASLSGTIDHDTINNTHNLTTDIDHNQLTNYAVGQHRIINDSGTSATELWSASKINTELGNKDDYDYWTFAVDGVSKDNITSGDVFDIVGGDNITVTRTAEDQVTISGTAGGGSANHSELNELDYASAGHTGFSSDAHHDRHDPEDGADALDCAAAGSILADDSAAEGSAHTFARSDHTHGIICGTPEEIACVQESAEGSETSFSRRDHQHGISHDIENNHVVTIDDTDAASGDYAKFTSGGLEGRNATEVRADIDLYSTSEIDTLSGTLSTEIDGDISTHNTDTTSVHGITDTSDLGLKSGNVNQFNDITSTGANIEDAVTKRHTESHHDRHDPEDGADALDCAVAGEIVGVAAAAEGSAHSFARSDHRHQVQHSMADNHIVTVDDADVASGDFARFTGAGGLQGRTPAEVLGILSEEATAEFDWNAQNLINVGTVDGVTISAHHDRHDPQDGADALDCAAAAAITQVQAAAEGSAHEFARADHIHAISHSIANNKIVTVDDTDAAATDYAKFTTNGLQGRDATQVRSDLSLYTQAEINAAIATFSGTIDHNTILNLQGGTTDEYYHLTANEEAKISATDTTFTLGDGSNSVVVDLNGDRTYVVGDGVTVLDLDADGQYYMMGQLTHSVIEVDTSTNSVKLFSGSNIILSATSTKVDITTDLTVSGTAQVEHSIANNNVVTVDGSGPAEPVSTDYARWTANGLEGRSPTQVRGDINVEDGATADQNKSDIDGLGVNATYAA